MSHSDNVDPVAVTQTLERRTRRSGLLYLVLGFLIAALVVTVWLLVRSDNAKEAALARLNAQFVYCADPGNANKPYCSEPVSGPEGQQGLKGEPGRDGVDGSDGQDGADGATGGRGQAGTNGRPGQPGANGQDGQTGTAGSDGEDGSNGLNGKDGSNGKDGATGAAGADGAQGPQGPQGDQGPAGPPGVQGPAGPAGVVDTRNDCVVPDGEFISGVGLSYEASTQTIVLTCTTRGVLLR